VHLATTGAAAAAGKHVFLDKPIANTVAEGREIALVCEAAGVVLALGYQRRRESHFRWIKAEIALPTVAASLGDRDWKVRMSAIKALTRLGPDAYMFEIEALRNDPEPRVRRTGRIATHRFFNKAARPWKWEWR